MLDTFINVIVPIFLVMIIGFIYGKRLAPDSKTFSSAIIYLFSPALVIDSLQSANLHGDILWQVVVVIVATALIGVGIGHWLSRLFKLDKRGRSALILGIILFNGANYGIPFNTFMFGVEAEQMAVLYYTVSVTLSNTLGVFIVSQGAERTVSTREALMNVIKLPLFYATILGLVLNFSGVMLPLVLARPITILGSATIPAMLILIGIQVGHFQLNVSRLRLIFVASLISLIVMPIIGWGISEWVGMEGLLQVVAITQHAMPTAVIGIALATQFDGDVELVTGILLVTTVLSALTLTLWMQVLA
jgi:predicted permease